MRYTRQLGIDLLDQLSYIFRMIRESLYTTSFHDRENKSGDGPSVRVSRQPGMKNHIRQRINCCSACMEERPRQARQPVQLQPPSAAIEPMRHVGTDLFDAIGHPWLTLVDRYSGYSWVKKMKNTNTESITTPVSYTHLTLPTNREV